MAPQKVISEKALKVWRLTGLFYSIVWWVITIAAIILTFLFDWPVWVPAVVVLVTLLLTYLSVYLFPLIRWKRWRYDVRETEIEIQSGLFIIKRTLVPMVRVQHVDTRQGPLLRKYDLASMEISTAATIHEIPALDLKEADDLRFYISRMASVEEEDV
ncbi:PH domain-containing protein [Bacillus sp. CECT 9360]|uniref:PH domain-containing protein n=1 Tax=Bacillus sp. CECT 9360 TaxID=2845821 RepID=UPI001E3675C8|nr:PH domain-containing protein [Bacillus sp. CECT 9360]CAH0347196.1 hypothetical protein BCI9360_03585 [Bacillus sp. CECT 9360]